MNATTLLRLVTLECRLFLRQPATVFFSLAFPILLLLTFGATYGAYEAGKGFRFIDIYVPELVATVIANLALMTMPVTLTLYREQGIFKRWKVTPAPLWGVLLAQLFVHLAMLLVASTAIVAVAWLVFRVRFGGDVALIAAGGLLCFAALFALGLVLGGRAASVPSAQATGAACFFVMLFTSGAALPRNEFPPWLRRATEYVPLTKVVDVMTGLWVGDSPRELSGALLFLGAVLVVATTLAVRTFRWE